MPKREFDIVVFGASGMAGKYCIEQLHKYTSSGSGKLRWAVAGRNEKKLHEALLEVSSWVNASLAEGPSAVPVVIADVFEPETLSAMAKRTRCIVNTVGPYTRWGEPVIRACLDANTYLLDLSGELCYNERMRNKYHQTALEKGVVILATAGFDSVSCEMLLQFARLHFPGRINCLETFATFNEGPLGFVINSGTWESILEILSFQTLSAMRAIRERSWGAVFKKEWQPMEYRTRRPLMIGWRPPVPGFTLPLLCGDKPVASHSEFFRHEIDPSHKRTQVQTYLYMPLLKIIGLFIMLCVVFVVSLFPMGKRLLCDYPSFFSAGFFSKRGPTREQVQSCGFTLYGIATGWHRGDSEASSPSRRLVVRLDGPEAAYIATSICIVTCAICLLEETDKLPMRGGYLTPGFALEKTSLLERLQKNSFKFTVVEDSAPARK